MLSKSPILGRPVIRVISRPVRDYPSCGALADCNVTMLKPRLQTCCQHQISWNYATIKNRLKEKSSSLPAVSFLIAKNCWTAAPQLKSDFCENEFIFDENRKRLFGRIAHLARIERANKHYDRTSGTNSSKHKPRPAYTILSHPTGTEHRQLDRPPPPSSERQ